MSYKKINVKTAPKRTRKAIARFELTPEWRMMKADIDRGLMPQEASQVVLSDKDQDRYDIHSRRTVSRFLKKYIQSRSLPYTVKSFERRESGDFYFLVQWPVPAPR